MQLFPDGDEIPMEQPLHTPTPTSTWNEALVGPRGVSYADGHFHHSQHEVGADVRMHGMGSAHHPYALPRFTTPSLADYHVPSRRTGGLPATPPRDYEEASSPPRPWEWQKQQGRHFLPESPERMPHYDYSRNHEPQDADSQSLDEATVLTLVSPEVSNLLQACSPFRPPTPAVEPQPAPASLAGPPVQEWPTQILTANHHQRRRTKKINKDLPLEQQIKEKQELYRQKGELKRQQIREQQQRKGQVGTSQTTRSSPTMLPPCEPLAKKNKKRKADGIITHHVPPTPPPCRRKRQPDPDPVLGTGLPDWYRGILPSEAVASDDVEAHYYADMPPLERSSPYTSLSPRSLELCPSSYDRAKRPPTPPPHDWDMVPQPIVPDYEDYKWSVNVYSLEPSRGFPYAQCFLDVLTNTTIARHLKSFKWASHTTRGFIRDGSRFSLLVLNNAANPFTWDSAPDSTTTIGVYGRYWYQHSEIHWVTFAPGIADLLYSAEQQGCIARVQHWGCYMQAREKRFHRAYWLAANRLPLGGLLSHGGDEDGDEDVPEVPYEDEFKVSEEDLQDAWDAGVTDASLDEARLLWERLLEDVELANVPEDGWEHVVTGGSELYDFPY